MRHPKFTPKNTTAGWCINVPGSHSESGKRERRFFTTRAKASEYSATLRSMAADYGRQGRGISPGLASEAIQATALLARWEVSLLDAARRVVAECERSAASLPVGEAVERWIASCEGLRPATLSAYRNTGNRLMVPAYADRLLSSLTAEDLAEVIGYGGDTARRNCHRNLTVFLRWAEGEGRGWARAEVMRGVEKPRAARDHADIGILTVEATESLMRTAERLYPLAVPWLAVMAFAGVRHNEVVRLTPEAVTPSGITLGATVAKKGVRRHITPSAQLHAWLTAYPFAHCPQWPEVFAAVRSAAGWDCKSKLLIDPPPATRGAWPQNALRHGFASYTIASGVSPDRMLFGFGHTGSLKLLQQHYVGVASAADATRFFAILPSSS